MERWWLTTRCRGEDATGPAPRSEFLTLPRVSQIPPTFPGNFLELDDALGPWEYHRCREVDEMVANDGIESSAGGTSHVIENVYMFYFSFSRFSRRDFKLKQLLLFGGL